MTENAYPYQWRALVLMSLAGGMAGLAQNSVAFLFPYLSQDLDLGIQHNGYLMATLAGFAVLSIVVGGRLAEMIGQIQVMVPGLLLAAAGLLAVAATQTTAVLYLGFSAAGLGAGCILSTMLALLGRRGDPDKRGLFYGVAMAAYTLVGSAGGSLILTRMAAGPLAWRGTSLIIALALASTALALFVFGRDLSVCGGQDDEGGNKAGFADLVHEKQAMLCLLLGCLVSIWYFVLASYGMLYLMQSRGLTAAAAGTIFAGFGLGGAAGEALIPILSDVLGRRRMVIVSAVIACVCFPLFLLAPVSRLMLAILLCLSAFFVSGALDVLTFVSPTELVPAHLLAAVTAIFPAAGQFVGSVLAPMAVGALTHVFSISSLMLAMSIVLPLILAGGCLIRETAPRVLERRETNLSGHQQARA
jgi:ACS family hexuronate transporter-like MFS transporter